ncbi:MAG: ScyD/ScyE family protein [Myxococcota bacterium]|nr:ScyD/ScyE family protein [Myxococcota bacterium]
MASLNVAGAATHRVSLRTVARGLDNPRGLVFLSAGTLAVAEAGHAGNVCLAPGQCLGLNGRVTAIKLLGEHHTALVTGLPSFGGPFGTFGAGGLAVQRGRLYSIVGLNPQSFGDPTTTCAGKPDTSSCVASVTAVQQGTGLLNRVKSLSSNRGVKRLAGVGRIDFDYAAAHPDPGNPEYAPGDGNPFGLIAGPSGGFYVVDAASNTLDFVSKRGRVSVLATVPDPPSHKPIYDAAPTCATGTPNGDLIVATESSSLWRWNGKHLTKVLSRGKLGQTIGCTADKHGNLYLINLAAKIRGSFSNFEEKPFDGSIVKVTPKLKTSYVLKGLNFPTGLTFGPDGHLYVALNGLCPAHLSLLTSQNSPSGGCPASGKVVRVG